MNVFFRKGFWFAILSLPFIWDAARDFLLRTSWVRQFAAYWLLGTAIIYFVTVARYFKSMQIGSGQAIPTWVFVVLQGVAGYLYLTSQFTVGYALYIGYALLALGLYLAIQKESVTFMEVRL